MRPIFRGETACYARNGPGRNRALQTFVTEIGPNCELDHAPKWGNLPKSYRSTHTELGWQHQ